MSKKVIIIGGGAAGTSAAIWARKADPRAEITLIEKNRELKNILFDEMRPRRIRTLMGAYATKIISQEKEISIRRELEEFHLRYDSLVIATGADPYIPPVKGIMKKGVIHVQDAYNMPAIKGDIIILGAGMASISLAYNLALKRAEVTVIEPDPEILYSTFHPSLASMIRQFLSEKGIRFMLNTKINRILGYEEVSGIEANHEFIPAHNVVLDMGKVPNTKIFEEASGRVGKFKGIIVDEWMRTNLDDIYAAGDCCEVLNAGSETYKPIPLPSVAVKAGRIAGYNAAGGNIRTKGFVRNVGLSLDGLSAASIGATEFEINVDYKVLENAIEGRFIRALIRKQDLRILGCQLIGPYSIIWADILSLAIKEGMTLKELEELDPCFQFPFSYKSSLSDMLKTS